MRLFGFLLIIFCLSSCCRSPLTCRSEYLYPDYLASDQVGTPDFGKLCFYGQQVVIYWNLPERCHPTELKLEVRYGSKEQESFSWPISLSCGYRIYRLINEEYWDRDGIVSYKASLYRDEKLLTEFTHHIWTEIILFPNVTS